jgi:hypothetical protein
MKISKPCVFATLKMRSMLPMVLFSSRLSRTKGHASPVSLSILRVDEHHCGVATVDLHRVSF